MVCEPYYDLYFVNFSVCVDGLLWFVFCWFLCVFLIGCCCLYFVDFFVCLLIDYCDLCFVDLFVCLLIDYDLYSVYFFVRFWLIIMMYILFISLCGFDWLFWFIFCWFLCLSVDWLLWFIFCWFLCLFVDPLLWFIFCWFLVYLLIDWYQLCSVDFFACWLIGWWIDSRERFRLYFGIVFGIRSQLAPCRKWDPRSWARRCPSSFSEEGTVKAGEVLPTNHFQVHCLHFVSELSQFRLVGGSIQSVSRRSRSYNPSIKCRSPMPPLPLPPCSSLPSLLLSASFSRSPLASLFPLPSLSSYLIFSSLPFFFPPCLSLALHPPSLPPFPPFIPPPPHFPQFIPTLFLHSLLPPSFSPLLSSLLSSIFVFSPPSLPASQTFQRNGFVIPLASFLFLFFFSMLFVFR